MQAALQLLSNWLLLQEALTYRCCEESELQRLLAHIEQFPLSPVTTSPKTHTQAVTLPCTPSSAHRDSLLTGNARSQLCAKLTACTEASLRRLKLPGQNVPKSARQHQLGKIVVSGDRKQRDTKSSEKLITWILLICFKGNRLHQEIFHLPKNALLFPENHDFFFLLPLMLSYENTH